MAKLTGERIAPECGCVTKAKIVRGMCVKHYDQWEQRTPKDQRPPAPRLARNFWDNVDKSGDCWIWVGVKNRKGYGTWSEHGVTTLAHRYTLLKASTPPDSNLMACHHCDNPSCVNPSHLYWGTAKDNARDLKERVGIHNKGVYSKSCPKGHPMSGDNLRIYGKNKRFCRTCMNDRAREYQRRKRSGEM